MAKKFVYFFGGGRAEGNAQMKDLLGGKGAGLAEMANLGLPVPPGFTISTEACRLYNEHRGKLPREVLAQAARALSRLEQKMGRKLGDPKKPLLVSVRSGAKFSMPGMMDTILNLGLNDKTVDGLTEATKNKRFAYDAYRRFLQMFGDIVLGVDKRRFDKILSDFRKKLGVESDVGLTADALMDVVEEYKALIRDEKGTPFPQDPAHQLEMARDAVFRSWMNDRAIAYRALYKIPHTLGTAVNVQAMVFGNLGDTSATGVGFTRNPATGEKAFFGEYLPNAQGEDVVAGIRTPRPLAELAKDLPKVHQQLRRAAERLERHYRDMQDFEFTIEEGRLFMLQTRVGKRTGLASVRIAVDMVREGLIRRRDAVLRVEPGHVEQYLFPIFDPREEAKRKAVAKGLPAGPGAAAGRMVLDPARAEILAHAGEKVVLVREETSPDDIRGMKVSQGFITARGGMTSHAAVVARQMGKPCVVGCTAVEVDEARKEVHVDGHVLKEGDPIYLNGFTGNVYVDPIPVVPSEVIQVVEGRLKPQSSESYRYFSTLLDWADAERTLGIRANADIPTDAKVARAFGAEGIGLCRTEHMFFAEDRLPIMVRMILARTRDEREKYLAQLEPLQKADFLGLFREMKGYAVIIRLLDPPLHEFLPRREDLRVQIRELEITGGEASALAEKRKLLERVNELHEQNPMLGLRGCRLGITLPEVSEMQVRAILHAALEAQTQGIKVHPEIMIPLVGMESEMKAQKELVLRVAGEVEQATGKRVKFSVGTMIELPRAAVTADRIALEAEFFSFGTNDLTQTTFGFSRDDAGKFILFYTTASERCPVCQERLAAREGKAVCPRCGRSFDTPPPNLLPADPFATLDQEGVGALIEMAVAKGRSVRKGLIVGICGEHGGDPASIDFCHRAGLNYVSCSPYRVPIARLAAAQAALRAPAGKH